MLKEKLGTTEITLLNKCKFFYINKCKCKNVNFYLTVKIYYSIELAHVNHLSLIKKWKSKYSLNPFVTKPYYLITIFPNSGSLSRLD